MNPTVKKPKDLLSGVLFAAFGAFVLFIAVDYSFGTARRMGPGFFPCLLAGLCMLFGVILIVRSFFGEAENIENLSLRPMLFVLLGALLFGLLVMPAGLVIAIMVMVVVGSFADPGYGIRPALVTAAILAAGSTLVFVYLLGLPLPAFGYWIH